MDELGKRVAKGLHPHAPRAAKVVEGGDRLKLGERRLIGVNYFAGKSSGRSSGPVGCTGGGRCLELAVQFDGDVCGVAYLVGRPEVDDVKQEIVVRDLDFSAETSE